MGIPGAALTNLATSDDLFGQLGDVLQQLRTVLKTSVVAHSTGAIVTTIALQRRAHSAWVDSTTFINPVFDRTCTLPSQGPKYSFHRWFGRP
jgi:alpha-beta hydrolase superfamily lysophospholipase